MNMFLLCYISLFLSPPLSLLMHISLLIYENGTTLLLLFLFFIFFLELKNAHDLSVL